MPDSQLAAVTEYLQELLEAADSLDGVTVFWGPPTGDDKPAEYISVGFSPNGDSGDSEREWGPIGGGTVDETLSLDLMCEASGANGVDLKPSYTRSYEIAALVETAIREDISLGNLLLKPAQLSRCRGRYFRADKTRGHRVFQTLTGTARI